MKKRITTIILIICILILGGYFVWRQQNSFNTRAPNEYEILYYELGPDTNLVSICNKIAPNAAPQSLGFNPGGLRIYLMRSRCIMDIAINTKNKSLCKEVKTYSANSQVTGYLTSASVCEKTIDSNLTSFSGGGPLVGYQKDAKWLMETLGYNDSIVPDEIKANSSDDPIYFWSLYIETYGRTKNFPSDFESRMNKLPSFSK